MVCWRPIPGTLCTTQLFDPLCAALTEIGAQLQVCGGEVPWHKTAPETAAGLTGLEEEFVVLSFSLGNFIALELAVQHPDRCRGLVLIGATGRADRPENAPVRKAQLEKASLYGRAEMVKRDLLPAYFGSGQDVESPMVGDVLRMAEECSQADFAAQTEVAISRSDYLSQAGNISVPALVLNGSADRATPPDRGRELAGSLSNGEFREIGAAGHFALLEQPMKCARVIADWAQRENL